MSMRIIVYLFIVSSWYIKESHGLETCPPNVTISVIHVCYDNELNDLTSVYVSTRYAPLQQAIECTCTITSSVSSDYTLAVEGASEHHDEDTIFTFAFNDITITDNTNFKGSTKVYLTGETIFKYTSPNDTTVLLCLYIAATTENSRFDMKCSRTVFEPTHTTAISIISTSETSNKNLHTSDSNSNTETIRSTERTSVNTEPQTNNNTTEDNTLLIAAAAGGGGVALVIIIVIIIVCCKRKRKSPLKEATSVEDTGPASFCDESDDDDYGMVLNPAYQPFHEVLPNQPPPNSEKVETNLTTGETFTSPPVYATPLKRKASHETANGITTTVPSNDNTKKGATCQSGDANNPASHYDYPRHHAAQVVTSDIDDTYDHTFSSTSGKWTGNEYNRVPMRRHDEQNVPDNDTYNVLKL